VRITRLQLRNVRRYQELDVTFAPGFTVVRGPNEAGKTTLQRALELALTRRVTSTGADLEELRSWDVPAEARPEIALEFVQEDLEGTRTGRLEKAFRGQKGTVRLEIDGEVITDPARADTTLAELTGVPTEPFFRSTASVHHHEAADLDRDEATLRDRLQASISGADRGTSRAKRQLDRAIRDLGARGERNPGRLKVAEEAVRQTAISLEQGEAALGTLAQDRDTLSGARERRSSAEIALAERRALLEKARQAERLQAERATALERYERYRTAVQVHEQIVQLNASHPSATPVSVLRATTERLRELDGQMRELRAALSGEVDVQFEVPPEPTWRPLSRAAIVLVLLGLAVAVGTEILQALSIVDLGQLGFIGGLAAAAIGLVLAVVAWWLRRGDRVQRELREAEISRRLRGRSQLEQELREAEAEAGGLLGSIAQPDLPATEALLEAEEAHVAQIDRLNAQLEGLVGREPHETLPAIRDAASLEAEQKASALEALGPIAKEPRARERLEVEVVEQEAALERARDDEAGARARVEANTVDAEQVAAEAERLSVWREQLAALQRRARVYAATLGGIERAEQATMRTATRYLEKHMGRDVIRITDGRYRRVAVDDRTLDIALFAPEKADWVPVQRLSQGTLDLVHLAARIGIVRLTTADHRPPLILDDPFVTLDDDRAARAVQVLRDLTGDFQVIYLTTSERYDSAADAVVELSGPTLQDPYVEPAETAPGGGLPRA